MIACNVERHAVTAMLVTFHDGRTLLLQSKADQLGFIDSCGLFPAGEHDRRDEILGAFDVDDITQCPEEYWDIAT